MIQIKNISKILGNSKVLANISLDIEDNSIFGLVGINGAGKSTLLRCISGVYNLEEGEILIDNENVYENNKIKEQILFVSDELFINRQTTIKSLIKFYETFYNLNKDNLYTYLNEFQVNITNKSLNTFSKGMKRRVLLSFALACNPKYLLLDEAFDGLDPLGKLKFKKYITQMIEENGMSVIIASHSLRELEAICDKFAMLNKGELVSFGNVGENKNDYYKVLMAFENEIDLNNFTDECIVNKSKMLRIVTLIVKCKKDDIEPLFSKYKPLTLDIIDLTFEESFVYQSEAYYDK